MGCDGISLLDEESFAKSFGLSFELEPLSMVLLNLRMDGGNGD